MYWDAILYEVRYKHSPHCFFAFTSLGGDEDEAASTRRKLQKRNLAPVARKSYPLGASYFETHFTQREAECIVKLLSGKPNDEVASEMALSKRTIEFYIKNMKSKLHCHTRQELIDKVAKIDCVWEWDLMALEEAA